MVARRRLLAALALAPAAAARSEPSSDAATRDLDAAADRALAGAILDIRSKGARTDGVSDDADAVVKAAGQGVVVFPPGVTHIGRDLVIHAPAYARGGAVISPASGVTVTFAQGLHAPLVEIFGGEGRVAFAPGSQAVGHPEWWGARTGDPALDCAPAIDACIEACPITQLQEGRYHIHRSILMRVGGRTLRGVGDDQNLGSGASLIVVEDGSVAGIVCGEDSPTRVPTTDYMTLEAFTVARSATIATPGGELARAPTGVRFTWCALLHVNRVTVREHAVGFHIFGCIECYFVQCSAIRYGAGDLLADDRVVGFFLDYRAPLGMAGGNASIYLSQCRAFTDGKVAYPYSAGLASRGGFVDLYISQLETGFKLFGIDLQGDGPGSASYSTQDCRISQCVLDSNGTAGIRVQGAGRHCDVHISGCYVALAGGSASSACVELGGAESSTQALRGIVTVSDCEFLGDAGGVSAENVTICNLALNSHIDLARPITFTGVGNSEIRDTARILHKPPVRYPAVSLSRCEGVAVAMSASGEKDGFHGGVSMDAGSSRIDVNCTRIDRAAVGGEQSLILVAGAPWGGGVDFGDGCIATGAIK
jgi:hypothetical protein